MSNVSWYDGCCSEEVVVFVSLVSPTTTVCGSFVGAVGGGGGGGASSVVLQSIVGPIVGRVIFFISALSVLFLFLFRGAFEVETNYAIFIFHIRVLFS